MSTFVNKYPAISLFVLGFALSGSLVWLVSAGLISEGLIFFATFGTGVAAIILVAIVDGMGGIRDLFRRFLIWRVSIWWYAVALLLLAPLVVLGLSLNGLIGLPGLDLSKIPPVAEIVSRLVIITVAVALGEEIGWRGFLLPRLQARYSALVSSIIIGVLWGLWHTPIFFIDFPEAFPHFGHVVEYGFIPAMLFYMVLYLIPWSIQHTWVFNNTKGSLLLVSLVHASEVWVWVFMDPGQWLDMLYWVAYAVVMTVASIIIVLVYGAKNLSRTSERIMPHET